MDDDERKARLAQALRANLRRRKAQARGVDSVDRTRQAEDVTTTTGEN